MTPNWVDSWIPAAEVARAAGVDHSSVRHWAARNAKWQYRVRHRIAYLHPTAADAYMQDRAAARPHGWLGLKQAAAIIGLNHSQAVRRHLPPDARTVRVGKSTFIHPADVEHARLLRQDQRPPLGWIRIGTLTAELNRSQGVLTNTARSLGITVRRFRPANHERGSPPGFISPNGAAQLREWSAKAERRSRR